MNKLHLASTGNRHKREIAMTFDDGPNPYFTSKILEILDDFNVGATFFVIGQRCIEYPEILKEIQKRQHLIGNHTFTHRKGDFKICEQIINQITGNTVKYVRPPYYDLNFCIDEAEFLQNKIVITGEVDPKDYLPISENELLENVLAKINNGSIIDFHDGSEIDFDLNTRSSKTIKILPKIISTLVKMKYNLVRIDSMSLEIGDIYI